MPDVGYNARAFTIDNEPHLFLSACIHYFRVPHELWADRIAKAKRGGMNTIETYVAWNFHEPEQGQMAMGRRPRFRRFPWLNVKNRKCSLLCAPAPTSARNGILAAFRRGLDKCPALNFGK